MISVNLPVPSSIVILLVIVFCMTQILNSMRRLFDIPSKDKPLASILIGAGIDLVLLIAWVVILIMFVTNLK